MTDIANLVCVPFAGGGGSAYRTWQSVLGERVRVRTVPLPGREALMRETPATTHEQMMAYLIQAAIPLCRPPFALYGHSMGARLAFELARELRRRRLPGPAKLLVSGAPAPRFGPLWPPVSGLADREFEDYLRRLGGTPEIVLRNHELLELLIPLLRADFGVSESYVYTRAAPLDCPIVAWGGWRDSHPPESIAAWTEESRLPGSTTMVDGGHFFIRTAEAHFLDLMAKELAG